MSFENLKNKILQEAQDNKEKLISAAEHQAHLILEKGKKKAEEDKTFKINKLNELKSLKLQKEKSRLQLEHQRNIGILKSKYFEMALERFISYLINDEEAYKTWMKNLVESFVKPGEEIILIRKDDQKLISGDFKILPEKRVGLGGFFIKKDKYELNFTLDEFIRWIKLNKRQEIYELLFPKRENTK